MYFKFAYRYLVSKKSTNAINIIAWVSITAIALVTAAMILIMSVFNGLTDLVKSLYTGFYADLKVVPANGKTITLDSISFAKLSKLDNIATICKVAEEKALLKIGESQTVVTLKGVDSNFTKISSISSKIIRGQKYDLGDSIDPNLILGYGVENALNVLSGPLQSGVTVYIPNRNQRFTGKLEDFNTGVAKPSAAFAIQQDFDNKYVITNLDFAKSLISLDQNTFTQFEININNKNDLETTKMAAQSFLGKDFKVLTRFEQNKSLFSVMRNEKWAAYAIFCLVLLIASFTIIGALTMLVLEKKKDIGILKSIGASNTFIQNIFLYEGILLGVLGVLFGTIFGLVLCFLQTQFKLVKLEGGSFLIDHYPVRVSLFDVLLVAFTVIAITTIAGFFPAKKAAVQHAELKN